MASVTIGQQRSTAVFQTNTPVASTSGGETEAWTDIVTTSGYLRKKSGSLILQADNPDIFNTYEFTCRNQLALSTIGKHNRILINGQKFRIDSFDKLARLGYIIFQLKERE